MQHDGVNPPIDLMAQRLKRNAVLSARNIPAVQRSVSWIDMMCSDVLLMSTAQLPFLRRPTYGEICFSTTALSGATSFVVSPASMIFTWSAAQQQQQEAYGPFLPKPRLVARDDKLERTPARGSLSLV